jgi:hypothetical protein
MPCQKNPVDQLWWEMVLWMGVALQCQNVWDIGNWQDAHVPLSQVSHQQGDGSGIHWLLTQMLKMVDTASSLACTMCKQLALRSVMFGRAGGMTMGISDTMANHSDEGRRLPDWLYTRTTLVGSCILHDIIHRTNQYTVLGHQRDPDIQFYDWIWYKDNVGLGKNQIGRWLKESNIMSMFHLDYVWGDWINIAVWRAGMLAISVC